jgi:hypothetical protein
MTLSDALALKNGASVNAKWCRGDPVLTGAKDVVGMMDQVIMKAQQQAKADAITDARFFINCDCLTIKGKAAFSANHGAKGKQKQAILNPSTSDSFALLNDDDASL